MKKINNILNIGVIIFTSIVSAQISDNITIGPIGDYFIISVYDQDYVPYVAPTTTATLATAIAADGVNDNLLNIQGALTTTGVTIRVPYTVVTAPVTLPAFSQTITIPASYTQDGISRDVTFSYSAATLPVGSGIITGTLNAVGGTLNTKQLDLQTGVGNDYLGWLLAQFTYYKTGSTTDTFNLRNITGIPDKNINDVNHRMFYLPVTAEDGRIWLNNNLGAHYANSNHASFNPSQQATSRTDHLAYGSLFQWGRKADGHELINFTSATTGTPVNGTTTTKSDNPTNALFITGAGSGAILDWRVNSDNTLWQTVASANNPCPVGFRVPTLAEVNALAAAAAINNYTSAYNSKLKITSSGKRQTQGGTIGFTGTIGFIWTSTPNSAPYASGPQFSAAEYYAGGTGERGTAYTMRCIQDENFLAVRGLNPYFGTAILHQNKLTVTARTAIEQVLVFDMTGRLVLDITPKNTTTTLENTFYQAVGVYVVKVKLTNGQVVTSKLLNKN